MTLNEFFVLHLREEHRPSMEMEFQIQILGEDGRAKLSSCISAGQRDVSIGGISIPQAVLEAAYRQPLGRGDYVNESGQSIKPF